MSRAVPIIALLFILWGEVASAQVNLAGFNVLATRQEKLGDKHWLLSGSVELEREDVKFYADEIEVFEDEDRAVARGNVVFTQGNNRISADSAEFNIKTRLGTFRHASGIASIQPSRQQMQPAGIAVPQASGVDTDVYFFGDTVEKLADKKYRISNGGFSTCVQPTPRWNLSAETIILNIDHYTLLRQVILKVKGVPMLYLPLLYYPTKEDGRATGVLIPTYGSSTVRGQTIHNAFFWAIDRSQDATFLYDWYSRTGSGAGTEYRYNWGDRANGTVNVYFLDQHATSYVQSDGSILQQAAERSVTVNGSANQLLPANLRGRARINYFSSIAANQTFSTNVYDAARNNSSYGGNVVGAWNSVSLNGTFDRNEYFSSQNGSTISGNGPRISVTKSDRPLWSDSPVYFGFTSDIARLERFTRSNGQVVDDRSLGRLDLSPQVRYPFKKWQWFTVNSSLNWRQTFYTRSLNPETMGIEEDNVSRQYFTLAAQAIGPVLTRVWDTPGNRYAERFKHSIEPFFNVQRTSRIAHRDRIVVIDGSDSVYGDTTSLTYGVNNRIYAKRRIGQLSQAREIISFEATQSYYTDARASQIDPQYTTSNTGAAPSNFSPFLLSVRATPANSLNATLRAEVDSRYHQLRTLSANGTLNWSGRLETSIGWSHKFFIEKLSGFNDPTRLDHYLNFSAGAHTDNNQYGSSYSFNYDVLRSTLLQERISAFYNAQCCGIAFEYQRYNFAGLPSYAVPADHRFFLSFTLAGLGNFSPFNGGLGAVPR